MYIYIDIYTLFCFIDNNNKKKRREERKKRKKERKQNDFDIFILKKKQKCKAEIKEPKKSSASRNKMNII